MELSRSGVGTPPDFTPGFIKSSPSGGRRPPRLDRSSSSMKKGETSSSAGVAGRHKVIQVSLQQDVKLHTADNAWKLVKKDIVGQDDDAATQVGTDCVTLGQMSILAETCDVIRSRLFVTCD